MSKTDPAGSAGSPGGSAAANNVNPSNNDPAEGGGSATPETVSYDVHRRLLEQRKKDQIAADERERKLAEFEKAERERQEADAKKRGDYDKILAEREKRIAELESENNRNKKVLSDGMKLQAFVDQLPGKVANHEYLSFVNLDEIPTDSEGNIDKASLQRAVQKFMKDHGRLVETKTGKPLPGGPAGAAPNGKISHAEWLKLPLKEKKARWNDVDLAN